MAKFGLKNKSRDYMCLNCGHIQKIQTNHTASLVDRCDNCSWKPSWTEEGYIKHSYDKMSGNRKFVFYNDSKANLVRKNMDKALTTFGT